MTVYPAPVSSAPLPANRSSLYLPPDSPDIERIWVVEGAYPSPDWPPGAEMVFVLNPPPLDLPLLAGDWPAERRLVLVSPRTASQPGQGSPLCELLSLPTRDLAPALDWLRGQPSPVIFLSVERRSWYGWLIPPDLRDRYRLAGPHHDFYFDGYHPHRDSFLFDDGYRRTVLGVLSWAQSSAYFLKVLEDLPYTPDPPAKKRMLFRDAFPFYTAGAKVDRGIPFDWRREDEASVLAMVRQSVAGPGLAEHATEYALAITGLSEVAACFTHTGRGELYAVLLGELMRFEDGEARIAPGLSAEQWAYLRREQPNLYLHLSYRPPNQCLVAGFDAQGLPDSSRLAAGDALLARLQAEEDLSFAQRDHEITALAGTLCQLHTFAGRRRNLRAHLIQARERGRLAMDKARPFERGRDVNYWIQALLSDWVLFPEVARTEPGWMGHYQRLLNELERHLIEDPDNPYNLMILFLAAGVEGALPETNGVRTLMRSRQIGPARLAERFARDDYVETFTGNYALALAAGYATLADTIPDADRPALDESLTAARRFFACHSEADGRNGAILATVGLKLTACDLYDLSVQGLVQDLRRRATDALQQAHVLAAPQVPATVLDFLASAAEGKPVERAAALRAVFSLPY